MSAKRNLKAGRFAALAGRFWRDPDRHLLSLGAQVLYCAGLSYAADQMSDGVIPSFMVTALLGPHATAYASGIASGIADGITKMPHEELVECGWWSEEGSDFKAIGWEDYNPTREEIESKSKKQRENAGKRWGKERDAKNDATGNAPPDPRPQTPEDQTPAAADAAARASGSGGGSYLTEQEPLETSAPRGKSEWSKDVTAYRATILAGWMDGFGNELGLTLDPSSPTIAAHLDKIRAFNPTRQDVVEAAQELGRERWWERDGKRKPGLRHFAERFEGYLIAARERSENAHREAERAEAVKLRRQAESEKRKSEQEQKPDLEELETFAADVLQGLRTGARR